MSCMTAGKHVKFARFVLLAVSEEAKTCPSFHFLFRSMHNKKVIRFGFCDAQNNQGRGYQSQPSADNPYIDLDYFGCHKNRI